MPPPPPPPPPPPELPDEILGEAFLRLPTDDPACLLRASLACKRWRRILADPVFRRRHQEIHRTPSLVGFLRIVDGDEPFASRFVPNNPASGGPVARDLPGWLPLDCRHGRALFVTLSSESRPGDTRLVYDFILWDPLTNERRRLPRPSPPLTDGIGPYFNAAVLCAAAAEGCNHHNCHGGPFLVAIVWSGGCGDFDSFVRLTSARVYSSETGNWSEPICVEHPTALLDSMPCPSTLVGDTLYFRFDFTRALEYQLGTQRLSIIHGPPLSMFQNWAINLMSMEDGGLGCIDVEEDESSLRLRLWSREAASHSDGVAVWTRGRAIELDKLLPDGALPSLRLVSTPPSRFKNVDLLGFAEGTDVTFVSTRRRKDHPSAVYMVQLNSGGARKVFDRCTLVIPYTSFCIPVTDASSTKEGKVDDALRA